MSGDHDVLYATIKTLKIFENFNCFKNKTNVSFSDEENLENDLELLSSSLMGDNNVFSNEEISDTEKGVLDDHMLNDIEVKPVIENITLVHEMYKIFLDEIKNFEKEGDISCIQDYSADVMDISNISKKIDQMQLCVNHIKTIAAETVKLKQVLRSNVLNDIWKINKDYHKAVINFFKLASELTNYIENFVHSLETSKSYNCENLITLKNREIKVLAALNENMDVLTNFQNYVQNYINSCEIAEEKDLS